MCRLLQLVLFWRRARSLVVSSPDSSRCRRWTAFQRITSPPGGSTHRTLQSRPSSLRASIISSSSVNISADGEHTIEELFWMSPCAPLDGTRALPEFVELDLGEPVEGVEPEDVKALQALYREHCEVSRYAPIDRQHDSPAHISSVKDVVINGQTPVLWRKFY